MAFEVLKPAILDGSAARLGRLAIACRRSLETPNFFAVTSRGAVPHITPDNVSKHLQIGGAYMALEDCKFYSVIPLSTCKNFRLTTQNSHRAARPVILKVATYL